MDTGKNKYKETVSNFCLKKITQTFKNYKFSFLSLKIPSKTSNKTKLRTSLKTHLQLVYNIKIQGSCHESLSTKVNSIRKYLAKKEFVFKLHVYLTYFLKYRLTLI